METFEHVKSGERVVVDPRHPEFARLRADKAWKHLTSARARAGRGGPAAQEDGATPDPSTAAAPK